MMIVLCTDFGTGSPYIGQMKVASWKHSPQIPVIELFSDLPAFEPQLAAYLLPAYLNEMPENCAMVCVVDPGVGSSRKGLVLQVENRWLVGPDNGLLAIFANRFADAQAWEIKWHPLHLSASFHGRDWFMPIASDLLTDNQYAKSKIAIAEVQRDWPEDLFRIVYVDQYGNAITGVRASSLDPSVKISIFGHTLVNARVFSDVTLGSCFWYENSNGLVEIAVNQGSAAASLQLKPGDEFRVE